MIIFKKGIDKTLILCYNLSSDLLYSVFGGGKMFEKGVNISLLLDLYGPLLTERQREIVGLYRNDDLSLGEISEITGITRQGVRDRIVKSEEIITELENKLGLASRFGDMGKTVTFIIDRLNQLKAEGQSVDELIDAAKKLNKDL